MPPPSKQTGFKPLILIIEDNQDQWTIIDSVLRQQFPEVEPVWFSESGQAILFLDSCPKDKLPRLILLDLYLPTCEVGWQTLELIKTHYLFREIPIVVLSSSSNPEDIRESYVFRANSYIIKPSNLTEWRDMVSQFRHYWWGLVSLPDSE